jgi:F0F1-type ATP synthase assembly protein I
MGRPQSQRFLSQQSDDRSPLARATEWVSVAATAALEIAVPILIGFWLDKRLGTHVLFMLIGVAVGITACIWSLLRMAAPGQEADKDHDDDFRRLNR